MTTRAGLPVDSSGDPARDPTANVTAIVKEQGTLFHALMEAERRYVEARIGHVEDLLTLRSNHNKEMREAESRRVDANRQVDVLNQSIVGDRQLVAIQTLATTSKAEAETLRATVQTTATSIAASSSAAMSTVNERLAALELSSAKGEGKQAVADPMIKELLNEVQSLRAGRAGDTGGAEALAKARQRAIAVFAVVVSIAGVVSAGMLAVAAIIVTVILKFIP